MVNEHTQPIKSSVLKCGKRTFFFDVKKASNNKNYLKITESAFVGEAGERKRNSFLLFSEDLINFQSRLSELSGDLN
jgi:hypothetical protein